MPWWRIIWRAYKVPRQQAGENDNKEINRPEAQKRWRGSQAPDPRRALFLNGDFEPFAPEFSLNQPLFAKLGNRLLDALFRRKPAVL
jgi:hypothetical protein